MKTLHEILKGVPVVEINGDENIVVRGLSLDSRNVMEGFLFACLNGEKLDGHSFVEEVVGKGAKIIFFEKKVPAIKKIIEKQKADNSENQVTFVQVADTKLALAIIASNFYDNPSSKLKLVAVTGTNGKTTVATLLWQLFSKLGYKTGLISTVGDKIGNETIESNRTTPTTPDSITLNFILSEMVKASCTHAFMEFSSHALDLGRLSGIHLTGGIFTNLTQDHLDYHKNIDEYAKAKKVLFDNLHAEAFAISNADDSYGEMMVEDTKANKKFYSFEKDSEENDSNFIGNLISNDFGGIKFEVGGKVLESKLIGMFNAYNLIAIYSTAIMLDIKDDEIIKVFPELKSVEGRFECVTGKDGVNAVVDYAHTPDALEKIIKTIVNLIPIIDGERSGKLITLFGCGGDRDSTKRPIMGHIAGEFSDITIITSDNPRSEDPQKIIDQIIKGIDNADLQNKTIMAITDRHEAIKKAVELATPGDVILLAGKGHEKYQIVGTTKTHFDDLEEIKNLI